MVFPEPWVKLDFSHFFSSYISSLIQKRKLGGNLFNQQTLVNIWWQLLSDVAKLKEKNKTYKI